MMTMDAIFGHQYAHISPKPPVFPTAGCSSFKIQPPCQTRQECCLKMCLGKFFDFGNMYKYNLYRSEKSVESVLNPLSPFGFLVVSNIFYFHPYLGKVSILTNIFQRGWNHQPDSHKSWRSWKHPQLPRRFHTVQVSVVGLCESNRYRILMGLVGIFTYMNGGFFMVNVGIIYQ